MTRSAGRTRVLVLALMAAATAVALPHARAQSAAPATTAPALDYATFRDRVQPIFLFKRPGHARCYVCHSQGTTFRLQRLSPGRDSWTEEESRKNFEAAQRLVTPGKPETSRLLLMPLAADAGGILIHSGGKHWSSRDDPEWQTLAAWVKGSGQAAAAK